MNTWGGDIFRTLLSYLATSIDAFPDLRRGTNAQYSIKDITLSAFAVFSWLFGIQTLPTDNQIRNLLDPVDPMLLRSAHRDTFSYLRQYVAGCPRRHGVFSVRVDPLRTVHGMQPYGWENELFAQRVDAGGGQAGDGAGDCPGAGVPGAAGRA
jgi:hypothetical protein